MDTKIILASFFGGSRTTVTAERTTVDYGQILHISEGITLPETFEAFFCNEGDTQTKKQIGNNNFVPVPDEFISDGRPVMCYIFLHDGADDGRVMYTIKIPIVKCPPSSDVEPTPVQQDVISETIAALTAARADIESIAADAHQAIEDAIGDTIDETVGEVVQEKVTEAVEEAKQSGDFKGDKGDKGDSGDTGPAGPKGDTGDTGPKGDKGDKGDAFTYADFTPEQLASLKGPKGDTGADGAKGDKGDKGDAGEKGADGKDGKDGQDGADGQDGHTPVITATKTGTTTTIFADGTQIAQIADGSDGQDGTNGTDGQDGHTPTITASKSGTVTTISVDGTAVAQINDGADGDNGDDGTSPTCTVTDITGGHRVTITDATGTSSFDVMDGSDATVQVSILSPTGNTHTLLPFPVTYNFGEKAELTVTVTATTQYHFAFSCPTGSATVLDILGITGMAGDTLEAGKTYEVDVWNGIALIKEMEVVTS